MENINKNQKSKNEPFWVTHPEYYPNGPDSHLPPPKKESRLFVSVVFTITCLGLFFGATGICLLVFGTPYGWLLLIPPIALLSYSGQKTILSQAFAEAHNANKKAELRKQRIEKRSKNKSKKSKIQLLIY
ncbi:MAG: hypothetical protein PHR53_09515 [Bacteroidales bacterium]|nr:hypothetical protein [Bacteroidales bacterium]